MQPRTKKHEKCDATKEVDSAGRSAMINSMNANEAAKAASAKLAQLNLEAWKG